MSKKSLSEKNFIQPDNKKLIANRINRIEGQIGAIKRMIEDNRDCNDLLIQVVSVEKSMKSLSNCILESHLQGYFEKEAMNSETINELIELFKRFND